MAGGIQGIISTKSNDKMSHISLHLIIAELMHIPYVVGWYPLENYTLSENFTSLTLLDKLEHMSILTS